jgi:hypothetical protein
MPPVSSNTKRMISRIVSMPGAYPRREHSRHASSAAHGGNHAASLIDWLYDLEADGLGLLAVIAGGRAPDRRLGVAMPRPVKAICETRVNAGCRGPFSRVQGQDVDSSDQDASCSGPGA